VNRL